MLSNAYFLAKFHFDTAENEPAKNLQNLNLLIFPILITLPPQRSLSRCVVSRELVASEAANMDRRRLQMLQKRKRPAEWRSVGEVLRAAKKV